MITIQQQIDCVRREIAMRKSVYPRWIEAGKMTGAKAAHEIEAMQAVLATLESLAPKAPQPRGLFEMEAA